MIFGVLQLLSMVVAVAADGTFVDLSKDLINSIVADSPGAIAVAQAASADPLLRSAIVLENGTIVAEYYRDDVDENEPYQAWSVTKSFTSLLVGLLIDEGKLSLNDTLGEIFQDEAVWANVIEVDFRKNVTIQEILTHTSGLVTPPQLSVAPIKLYMPVMTSEEIGGQYNASLYNGGVAGGGSSVETALAALAVATKGVFQIVGTSQILSYVVQERSGVTPREYLEAKVLSNLGITEGDYGWLETLDEMQFAFHGLELTTSQMAKFGQLYLQGGQSKPRKQVVSKSWVEESTMQHVANAQGDVFFTPNFGYGYLFWIPPGNNSFCAFGMLGQDICVEKSTSRVIVQQRDWDPENRDVSKQMNLGVNYVVGAVASDPDLSFAAPVASTEDTAPGSTEDASTEDDSTSGSNSSPGPLFAVPLLVLMSVSMLVL